MTLTERIKARLRNVFPKANLSTKRMDDISAKLSKKLTDDSEDSAIDALLNDTNEVISFEEIAKQDDRERTLNEKVKELTKTDDNLDPKKKDEKESDDKDLSQTDKLLKSLTETIGGLKSDLEAIKSGKITESKTQSVQTLFDKSEVLKGLKQEIKANWIKRVELDSETSFEDQITALETEFGELVQVQADSTEYGGPAARSAGSEKKASDALIDEIMNQI